jgi:hypothetical protein
MGRSGKRFRYQTKQQVLKHLSNMLKPGTLYGLKSDPLGIYFEVRESTRQRRRLSDKEKRIREETRHLSKKKRRLSSTKKRIRPKIRSVKKGRTVNLKGVSY